MPTLAAAAGRSVDNVFARTIIVVGILVADFTAEIAEMNKIKIRRCNVKCRITEVAGNRKSFQKNLRADNGRTEIQKNAAVKLRHAVSHFFKINSGAFADCRHITGGMLMDNIGAECNVIRCRNVKLVCIPQNAVLYYYY